MLGLGTLLGVVLVVGTLLVVSGGGRPQTPANDRPPTDLERVERMNKEREQEARALHLGLQIEEAREYDRAVRDASRKREQSRKLRQQRCAELREHYKRRIEELCSRPFSWQQGN